MKRYIIWCRWSHLAGKVPNERDKEWNLETGRNNLWGFPTHEEAQQEAERFAANWQVGHMETAVVEVTLPD